MAGETKWSFWKLFRYSVQGILAFSTAPLAIASVVGVLSCLAAFVMTVIIVAKTLLFGDPVGGWPSLVCIVLFLGGVQLFCIGILGQYLAKTYLETKRRPIYILREEGGRAGSIRHIKRRPADRFDPQASCLSGSSRLENHTIR